MTTRETEPAAELEDSALPPVPRLDAWTRRLTDLLGITHEAPATDEEG